MEPTVIQPSNNNTPSKITFLQQSELHPVNILITHVPQIENFLSTLHPAGSLYLDVVNYKELMKNFECLRESAKSHGIKLFTVKEILQINRQNLEMLAKQHIHYIVNQNEEYNLLTDDQKNSINYFASDTYKDNVISKLDDDQLFNVIMSNPTYYLKYSPNNTNVEFEDCLYNPLGNLLYCRDQQIVTQKGVVMGRFNARIREQETPIMKYMWQNLGVEIVGEIPEGGTLEGGDFITVKDDLALLGIGIRSNHIAAKYLMENDLLGCERFGLVIDEKDNEQERMHLDTFFNVFDDTNAIMLDFEAIIRETGRDLRRSVWLYEKGNTTIKEHEDNVYYACGEYRLTRIFPDFKGFLEEEGYKVMPINHEEQLGEITNFLNIGNNTVLCVHKNLPDYAKRDGLKVEVKYIEFEEVKKMYGALHCVTQVSRLDKR